MSFLLIAFGLFSGCLLSILVGFIGRDRNIGFGWAFLLSLIFTPFIGLIITLLSDQRASSNGSWGCLGTAMGFIMTAVIVIAIIIAAGILLLM